MNWPSGSGLSPLHCNLSLYWIVKHIRKGRIGTKTLKSVRMTSGGTRLRPGAHLPVSVVSNLVWLCLSCGPMSMMAFSIVVRRLLTSRALSRGPSARTDSTAVKTFCKRRQRCGNEQRLEETMAPCVRSSDLQQRLPVTFHIAGSVRQSQTVVSHHRHNAVQTWKGLRARRRADVHPGLIVCACARLCASKLTGTESLSVLKPSH